MAANEDLERRVAALEATIAELQRRLPPEPAAKWPWELMPPVRHPEAFEEMIRLGREFREADRPPDEEEAAS